MSAAVISALTHSQVGIAAESEPTLAASLVERAGIQRGVCSVVTQATDDLLPIEIAQSSGLLVHVRCDDAATVERLRGAARDAGLGIDRVAVELGRLDQLPYADNMVDLLVVDTLSREERAMPTDVEVLRVLRPRGTAFYGGLGIVSVARNWHGERFEEFTLADKRWMQFSKPPLAGAGNWSHWEHGPDNNPVSEDAVIKAPYLTQYLAHPFYIAMPSITTAAGGRTFLAIGHITHHQREWDTMFRLIASNGYNGTVLWERKLPEGYLVHRSAFIATDDAFYMIDGGRALVLDPETGEQRGEIRIPGMQGDWKWMVLKEGVLYALSGDPDAPAERVRGDRSFGGWSWGDLSEGYYSKPHVPWGFGHTLAAYDLKSGKPLWVHKEEEPMDSRSLAMGEDRISVYSPGSHFRCLDLKTGDVLWTNDDEQVLELIEQPGKGLTSTPGFRTMCMALYTPDALIVQGQTRNNVVALSTADGYLLWNKKKVTNNPNAIYLDGTVILGVGEKGDHVAVDPISGEVVKDFHFVKRACTRLTACSDSLFVRGAEGTLRYDRESGKVLVDGAARPACNDGALPANGMLYVGPWQCDCNLSLIGRLARCSAGDFRFDDAFVPEERIRRADSLDPKTAFEVTTADWPTFRADNSRSSSTSVSVPNKVGHNWLYTPQFAGAPTAPTAVDGLVFVAGEDGLVKAIQTDNGRVAWTFTTNSPIKYPPTIADGRAYFGSGDGFAYCLDAATGREVWRFRAAPVERYLMLYGHMASTWPVHSGVLVHDGVAYFAAGIIDSDGTYVYAVDANTGEVRWENNSSGHLNPELRKGVSVQGNLTLDGDRLLLAGGNQVSPAAFDIHTGECLAESFAQGQSKANNGRFVGLFADKFPIVGGRILYSAPENVSTKGSFEIDTTGHGRLRLNFGGVAPAWSEETITLVNYQNGAITCLDSGKVTDRIERGLDDVDQKSADRNRLGLLGVFEADKAVNWTSDLGEPSKFQAVAIVVGPNAIVAAVQQQSRFRAQPQWSVVALDKQNGNPLWKHKLPETPLPDGLLIDGDGRIVVTLVSGNVLCLAPAE